MIICYQHEAGSYEWDWIIFSPSPDSHLSSSWSMVGSGGEPCTLNTKRLQGEVKTPVFCCEPMKSLLCHIYSTSRRKAVRCCVSLRDSGHPGQTWGPRTMQVGGGQSPVGWWLSWTSQRLVKVKTPWRRSPVCLAHTKQQYSNRWIQLFPDLQSRADAEQSQLSSYNPAAKDHPAVPTSPGLPDPLDS